MQVNAGPAMVFAARSNDRFRHEASGTEISFTQDGDGKVIELVLYRGGEHRARRVSDASSFPEIQTVEVNGTTLQAVVDGHGETPVVLVRGLENWAKVAKDLESEAHVVRYEPANANGDQRKRAATGVRTQARVLHGLLDTLKIPRPCLLAGHSYGGALVRIYTELYPNEVAGLILVDPFDEGFVDWLKANQAMNYERFRKQAIEQYVSDWDDLLAQLRVARVPKEIPVVLLTAGHRQIRAGDALETQVKPADFESGAAAIMKAHEAWINKVPNGRRVIVPGAGHDIPGEQPESVVEQIRRTIKQARKAAH